MEVNLYLSVTDLDGQPLTGLEQGDFVLYENDVPISDFSLEAVEHPMLIGIVIDSAVSFKTREGGRVWIRPKRPLTGSLPRTISAILSPKFRKFRPSCGRERHK